GPVAGCARGAGPPRGRRRRCRGAAGGDLMTLRLHNTLTGRKEEFRPLEAGVVRLYTCGPTVWNYSHLGNYRANLLYDLLRRHLAVSRYMLRHALNTPAHVRP